MRNTRLRKKCILPRFVRAGSPTGAEPMAVIADDGVAQGFLAHPWPAYCSHVAVTETHVHGAGSFAAAPRIPPLLAPEGAERRQWSLGVIDQVFGLGPRYRISCFYNQNGVLYAIGNVPWDVDFRAPLKCGAGTDKDLIEGGIGRRLFSRLQSCVVDGRHPFEQC